MGRDMPFTIAKSESMALNPTLPLSVTTVLLSVAVCRPTGQSWGRDRRGPPSLRESLSDFVEEKLLIHFVQRQG